ncbi:MAG: hypothetical protein JSS98_18195 [Bacteroidetes bacterium]|nr:hypothetical protein [Bacteroidota bacterium]
MKKYNFYLTVIAILVMTSCALQKGHIQFNSKPNEVIATPMIKEYMKLHPHPAIVLKAPNSENKSTQADPNSYIYNTIEKELLLAGFDVKDRGLFNEVVSKSNEINYVELKKLTGTELILELVQVSRSIEYGTNKYYGKDGTERTSNNYTFKKYGAVIEFKMTLIEKNQYAGSYSFNYTPCGKVDKSNCDCEVAYKVVPAKIYPHLSSCGGNKSSQKMAYEYVSQNIMEELVRNGVRQMIAEIKK